MRILEAQNAQLTNVEVYTFLNDQAKQYQEQKRRGPNNLESLRGDMIKYFETYPGPLSQKPLPYDTASIPVLLEKLKPYNFTKGECVMVVNLRPTDIVSLNIVLEDMERRFSETQIEEIKGIVIEVLGQFPPEPKDSGDAMDTTENGV
ncbi:HRDC-like protein [Astrocystis sublimbata]|nr:HRDC-like protein [Astrocystis sublimbata]